jgi:hypothetical protein
MQLHPPINGTEQRLQLIYEELRALNAKLDRQPIPGPGETLAGPEDYGSAVAARGRTELEVGVQLQEPAKPAKAKAKRAQEG